MLPPNEVIAGPSCYHALVDVDEARWATLVAEVGALSVGPDSTLKPASASPSTQAAVVTELRRELSDDQPRIEVHETIGEGGMGIVRRATQTRLRRDVAVKALRPGRMTDDRRLELLREARVMGALEHPNILPVHGVEIDEHGEAQVLLKRLENTRWSDLMHDGRGVKERFGRDDLLVWNLEVFMQVCRAVHFAHSRGIVHLDLKPENVMIGLFGEVYLVDWGIAMSLWDDEAGRFRLAADNRDLIGTPAFMAPEMLAADGVSLCEQTDVYLLGGCLFFATQKRAPHVGGSLMEVLHDAAMNEVPPASAAPQELATTIATALARDPADRHPTAEALRRDVRAFLDHRDSRRRSDEALERLERLEERATSASGPGKHAEVQQLFSECRFGFRGALGVWPDNPEAARGLRRAIEVAVGHELVREDAESAAALLGELDDPSDELLAALEGLRDRLRIAGQRAEQLERLEADFDITTGQRTRSLVVAILMALWAIAPLIQTFRDPGPPSYRQLIAMPALYLLLTLGLAYWARESLGRTAINRRLMASMVLALSVQLVVTSLMWHLDLPTAAAMPVSLAVFLGVGWMVVLFAERRVWPSMIWMTVCLPLTGLFPEVVLYTVSSAMFGLLINFVVVWWPWSDSAKRARGEG